MSGGDFDIVQCGHMAGTILNQLGLQPGKLKMQDRRKNVKKLIEILDLCF